MWKGRGGWNSLMNKRRVRGRPRGGEEGVAPEAVGEHIAEGVKGRLRRHNHVAELL